MFVYTVAPRFCNLDCLKSRKATLTNSNRKGQLHHVHPYPSLLRKKTKEFLGVKICETVNAIKEPHNPCTISVWQGILRNTSRCTDVITFKACMLRAFPCLNERTMSVLQVLIPLKSFDHLVFEDLVLVSDFDIRYSNFTIFPVSLVRILARFP